MGRNLRTLSRLAQFRKEVLKKSQEEAADLLGYEKTGTYAAQERGENPIPLDIKKRIKKEWKYDGPWPDEEGSEEAGGGLTREVLLLRGEVETLRKNQNDFHEQLVELATTVHALQSLDVVKAALAGFQKKPGES